MNRWKLIKKQLLSETQTETRMCNLICKLEPFSNIKLFWLLKLYALFLPGKDTWQLLSVKLVSTSSFLCIPSPQRNLTVTSLTFCFQSTKISEKHNLNGIRKALKCVAWVPTESLYKYCPIKLFWKKMQFKLGGKSHMKKITRFLL